MSRITTAYHSRQILDRLKRLVEPADSIRDPADRIRFRFLATLYLVSALGILAVLPIRYITDATLINSGWLAAIAAVSGLLLLIPYRLVLRGNVRLANGIVLVVVTGLIFALALKSDLRIVTRTLNYMLVVVLFASHFTSIRFTLAIGAVQAIGMALIFSQHMPLNEVLISPVAFHIIATLITVMFAYYRGRIETERRAELAQSESRYRKVSELNPNYSYSFRLAPGGELIKEWMTDGLFQITGYTWEEVVAMGVFHLYHPEDAQRQADDLDRVYQGQPASGEYRIITKNREIRWLHISRHPIWDDKGQQVVGYYGMAQDITHRRLAQEQQMKAVLQRERLVLMNDFVQAISHDFRTSLATIETSRYLLQRGLGESEREKAQPRLNVIQHFVFHMEEQLENLRAITALANLTLEACDLNLLTSSVLAEQAIKDKVGSHQVRFQPDPNLPPIHADSQELGRAIRQVVINGLSYMPTEGIVSLRTYSANQHAALEIRDTGIGIAPEHLDRVFDLFYRAEAARPLDSGGVGLGLSMARMIVEAHGGSVKVESALNEGSTFTLFLPIAPPE